MKFKICWDINGCKDHVIIEGNDIQDIKDKAATELAKRGISSKNPNVWSEEIKQGK